LLRASKALDALNLADPDEANGVAIVRNVLSAPLVQIATNAGQDGAAVLKKVLEEKEGFGYDAAKGEYVDMVEAGIIDPKMVVRSAIENAASVAAIFLTMESAICDIPEAKGCCSSDSGAQGGMGGMHGMM